MRLYNLEAIQGKVPGQIVIGCLIWLSLSVAGCKKLIEVDPPGTSINAANVYINDASATAVLTGIYTRISDRAFDLRSDAITSMSLFPSLSADELILYNLNAANLPAYYRNDIPGTFSTFLWNTAYDIIFTVNNAIEGLEKSTSLTSAVKQQLSGEAKFVRAFCYFYLVNLYGDVPLVLSTDWNLNARLPRSPKAQVYQQIIADLKDAQNLLSNNYLKSDVLTNTSERIRPNKWVAIALLSRVYLYTEDWTNAEIQSSDLINNTSLYSLNTLTNVFKMNSTETIWAFQPVRTGTLANTGEGALFILPSSGPNTGNYPVYLSDNIVNSFEANDNRKTLWTNSVVVGATTYYYPYKYKIGSINTTTQEYPIVFRLAEQYLIRAEARAQQNKISEAQADLNVIRARAFGAPMPTTASDKASLLAAIMQERKVELFTEWGHRWFDLKRTGKIDGVMNVVTPQKGGTWSAFKALYPIPQGEINLNPNLTQNTGY